MQREHIVDGRHTYFGTVLWLSLLLPATLISGCGGSSLPVQPQPLGKTQVVLLATSAGSDEPALFGVDFASLSLIGKDGKSVNIFNYPNCLSGPAIPDRCLYQEFMELNGRSSLPLLTVTIPQGVYTSATMNVGDCGLEIAGAASNGGVGSSEFEEGVCGQGAGETTVVLPAPITISGASMGLLLSLQVQQSYTLSGSGCMPGGGPPGAICNYTISPVFSLTPVQIAATPTDSENGLVTGIDSQVQSSSSGGFTATTPLGAGPLAFNTNAWTIFQGVDGAASLMDGEYIQTDAAIQSDGSLLSTRVEVDDSTAPYWTSGLAMTSEEPTTVQGLPYVMTFLVTRAMGFQGTPTIGLAGVSLTSKTAFKVSGEFSNLASLPFTATFDAQTMIGGQHLAVFLSADWSDQTYQGYPPAATITLLPQVINATVGSVSSSNGFTVYGVTLSPDDLIPQLQAITGPFIRPTNASSVVVYADSNTQMLASAMPAVGSIQRFRGLLFYDNGTLRMDCGQILDAAPAAQ